jgi:hypothetical protein
MIASPRSQVLAIMHATRLAIVFAALSAPFSAHAEPLNEVALTYLLRRGVPCLHVTEVDKPIRDFDMTATCDDGRQWALFFIEGEVAFIHPQTGEPFRWQREVYLSYPQVYGSPRIGVEHIRIDSDVVRNDPLLVFPECP